MKLDYSAAVFIQSTVTHGIDQFICRSSGSDVQIFATDKIICFHKVKDGGWEQPRWLCGAGN
jgi:hypothetical protein